MKEDVVVGDVVLIFVDGMYGGRYRRKDGVEHEPRTCVVCGSEIKWIRSHDFAAYVCFKHDPPLIVHTPWCNNESIERRELYQHEMDFMERYG